VIPDQALLRLNVRTFKEEVRDRVLGAIRRIVEAEADASGATRKPDISILSQFPITRNDEQATRRVVAALEGTFGTAAVGEIPPATASEDFGLFGTAWDSPSVFWVVGGIDPDLYAEARSRGAVDTLPANHAPDFAPVLDPTLQIGLKAMVSAALAWLAPTQEAQSR
jgi:hippurate hydrolase